MDPNSVNMQENNPEQTANVQNAQPTQQNNQASSQNSKAGIGVVCGIFLGLIGLLVGYLCYKDKNLEYEWKTFLKGWLWSFFITLGVAVVGMIIYFVAFASLFAGTLGIVSETAEGYITALVMSF